MINKLIKFANSLDKKGLTKEADDLDLIIKSAIEDEEFDSETKEDKFDELSAMGIERESRGDLADKVYLVFEDKDGSEDCIGVFTSRHLAYEQMESGVIDQASHFIVEYQLNKVPGKVEE